MTQKNNLLKLSLALLAFNLILAGFIAFNYFYSSKDIAKADSQTVNKVMGANESTPKFDKNFIMSNQTFSSNKTFPSQASVQTYLDKSSSPLRNYSTGGKPASYWIFAAARGETSSKWGVVPNINPGVIIAYLDKEQSLISLKDYDVNKDPENRIKYAMGYGCPDNSACDDTYNGFINQINWGSYQLQYNYNNAVTGKGVIPYKVGSTISTLDEYNVFLTNEATASNYRYTPHVCWGNYNLWKIITANGWGVDAQTYSYADLDEANPICKDQPVSAPSDNKIAFISVESTIRKGCNFGDVSDEIKSMQAFLRQEGYYARSELTGLCGNPTLQALNNYRIEKNISSDVKGSPSDKCLVLIKKNYNIGDQSDEIRDLQVCLKGLGVFDWPTFTGYFGEVTRRGQNLVRQKMSLPTTPPPTTPVPASCNTLKSQSWTFGETSDSVRRLQDCMTTAGTFKHPFGSTGYFGNVTKDALARWKGSSSSAPVASSCDTLKSQSWTFGETSERVKQLQNCMTTAGTFKHPFGSTGYFGDVTKQALIKWRGYM